MHAEGDSGGAPFDSVLEDYRFYTGKRSPLGGLSAAVWRTISIVSANTNSGRSR
ncbi:MAG: hypothetical protein CM1200mP2_38630 [Planctomycetaceae bacterium]|nr:MAG: hypothetical protein CM1200mP2_38630 [Planctomycetaceae bacterium]